jgi:hypothetical protein
VQWILELRRTRPASVVVSVRGRSRDLAWLRALRVAEFDAIHVRVGAHRLSVAFFLRLVEGSGGSASVSSDALARARLQHAADKRVVVPAYESFGDAAAEVASPSEEAWVSAFSSRPVLVQSGCLIGLARDDRIQAEGASALMRAPHGDGSVELHRWRCRARGRAESSVCIPVRLRASPRGCWGSAALPSRWW